MTHTRSRPARAYKQPREVSLARAVEANKNLKEVNAARIAFLVSQADAVAFDKVIGRLDLTVSAAMRQAMHVWMLFVQREVEAVESEETKRKAEKRARGTRGPPAG